MTDMTFDAKKKPVRKKAAPKKKPTATKKTEPQVETVSSSRKRMTAAQRMAQGRRSRTSNIDDGPLAVDTDKLDPDFHYYFVEDRPGRVMKMQSRDYDLVDNSGGEHDSIESGSNLARPSGKHNMLLMRKPKQWFEEDKTRKVERSKAVTKQLKKGGVDKVENAYIPEGGISITSD